jgi:hypothetical protein
MIPAREIEANRVEIGELESLIERMPDDPLAKPLLRSRLAALRTDLARIEQAPITKPETELLFAGAPVVGSLGIEAKFAGSILRDYQDILANHHAGAHHGGAGARGRRPGEEESKVYLSALPRGSFGLLLSQQNIEDFVTASQVSDAMGQITDLIHSATSDDASFTNTISEFDPRVLVPLQRFFQTLESNRATVTIRTGRKSLVMNTELVHSGYSRVTSAEKITEPEVLTGIFGGLTLGSRNFDFTPHGLPLITGKLKDSVSELEALAMQALFNQEAQASLECTKIKTLSGYGKPRYELAYLAVVSVPNSLTNYQSLSGEELPPLQLPPSN